MKQLFLFFALVVLAANARSQSLSINTDGSSAHTSAILDVKSNTKGMLVPRMTSAQRMAISTPANGLMVYDTDTNSFWYVKGATWTNLAQTVVGGGGQLVLPLDTTVNSAVTPFTIRNLNSGLTSAISGINQSGFGVYGYTFTGKGLYGYANGTGIGVDAYSSQGIGVRAISGSTNAIKAMASGVDPTIDVSATQGDAIYATTSATVKAAIKGEANTSGAMGVYGLSSAANGYGVRGFSAPGTGVYGQTNIGYGIVASANTGVGLRTSSTSGNALEVFGKLKIYGSAVFPQNGAVLTSDAEGNATWKLNRVAFKAKGSGTVPNAAETAVNNNVEEYDYSNHYNTTTGTFTAPVTGIYTLGGIAYMSLQNDIDDNVEVATLTIYTTRNGVNIPNNTIQSQFGYMWNGASSSDTRATAYGDVRLQAGDVVKFTLFQLNGAEVAIPWSGKFYGHLVFAE